MSHIFAERTAVVVDDDDSRREARGVGTGSVLTTIAGIVGAAVLVCVAIGWVFGYSILVFVTGSMAPTMPAGTAAVVERIDASAVMIGDVVTVPRPGETIPVTHRVVSVSEIDGGSAAARSLVLRGDANARADREPYIVEEVDRVMVAVPGAGRVIAVVQSPGGIGIAAAVVAMAILWAFWPARRDVAEDADADTDTDADTARDAVVSRSVDA